MEETLFTFVIMILTTTITYTHLKRCMGVKRQQRPYYKRQRPSPLFNHRAYLNECIKLA
ncbi:uncharacterized protein NEPG_02347 [Nematocida parisii ERTm1]|uniref:Uncharacterized protein n=1 Tax=Nematocida parisii (strain ERTm3) TaxID=935791 RepID=I3EES1_NEMP3|nr:uncharacterized protein NEPG_02347 [Nematocida parisii ERTm1]EIJ87718.1 hypothetical protein NEQG_02265 [Nematocida parisii ERTm3]EIJ92948.1 hypothetical protein NEPG_02347 [Nematocida parisii ERTm1]|eukprot:XP_013060174.1 hypothetical protein NEPG_02347 [Nematocida parisii ERTm1]